MPSGCRRGAAPSSAGGFSTGGGGQRPAPRAEPRSAPPPGPGGRSAAWPRLGLPLTLAAQKSHLQKKEKKKKAKNKSPASSGLAIAELCVSRTSRSRCPGMRLCAPGTAVGWAHTTAASSLCGYGGSAKAAASPENPLGVARQELPLRPSRAGRRAALTPLSGQGPPRARSDEADGMGS